VKPDKEAHVRKSKDCEVIYKSISNTSINIMNVNTTILEKDTKLDIEYISPNGHSSTYFLLAINLSLSLALSLSLSLSLSRVCV
jgi:hypothetical protein